MAGGWGPRVYRHRAAVNENLPGVASPCLHVVPVKSAITSPGTEWAFLPCASDDFLLALSHPPHHCLTHTHTPTPSVTRPPLALTPAISDSHAHILDSHTHHSCVTPIIAESDAHFSRYLMPRQRKTHIIILGTLSHAQMPRSRPPVRPPIITESHTEKKEETLNGSDNINEAPVPWDDTVLLAST